MASEAGRDLRIRELASEGLVQSCRLYPLIPYGDVQPVSQRIVTDKALVEATVALKHPSLRAGAKSPVNGRRKSARAISNGIRALAVFSAYRVGIRAVSECKFRVSGQDRIRAGQH